MKSPPNWKILLFVFVGYFVLGRSSLYFATMSTTVSPVWPATGFSVFCMLIWGLRVWPAIYLSAALVDITAQTPIATALCMALGNFLEPMVAVTLMNRITGTKDLVASHRRNLGILVGTAAGALVAAGIGNAALYFFGILNIQILLSSLLTWWTGDLIGAMFFTPIFLVFYNLAINRKELQALLDSFPMVRVFFILIGVLTANFFLYYSLSGYYFIFVEFYLALIFFLFLPSCWAYIFSVLVYAISIYANIHQLGPFHNGNSNEGLLHTQLFFAGFSVTIVSLEVFARDRKKFWPFVVLAAGWVIASGVYIGFVRAEEINEQEKFSAMSKEIASAVESNLALYESFLRAGKGFFLGHEKVNSKNWKTFVSMLQIDEKFRDINGLGIVERVPFKELKNWEARRAADDPGFAVHDVPGFFTTNLDDRAIISFVEPKARNKQAWGLILSTEPHRRGPLYRSLESQQASLSSVIQLVQDDQKRPGFLYFLPMFKNSKMVGWTYAPFVAEKVFNVNLAKYSEQIEYSVFFDGSKDPQLLLSGDPEIAKNAFSEVVQNFADAQLHFYFKKGKNFASRQNVTAAWTSMVTSLIVSLFAVIIANFQALTEEANRIADEKTKALRDSEVLMVNSAKFTALGEMAGGIAHEINNPLAIIKGLASQLERADGTSEEEKSSMNAKVKKIAATVDRISEIINGLRSFSRSGEADSMTVINIDEMIQQTLSFCEQRFYSAGVKFEAQLSCSAEVYGNGTQLSQVVLNLLNNAFDAIQELPERWIEIKTELAAGHVLISVIDSGPGIDPEVAKKIMQPFFTTKPIGKGTGLGLSISKGIIEAHRGSLNIDLESRNTAFVIRIPLITKSHLS